LHSKAIAAALSLHSMLIPHRNCEDITEYISGGSALGSCGTTYSDSVRDSLSFPNKKNSHKEKDFVVALAPVSMPASCGDSVTVTYNGVSVNAVVRDTCRSCEGASIGL
jgi:hypothetical protein